VNSNVCGSVDDGADRYKLEFRLPIYPRRVDALNIEGKKRTAQAYQSGPFLFLGLPKNCFAP